MKYDTKKDGKTRRQQAVEYLIPESLPSEMRRNSLPVLEEIVDRIGAPVDSYPTWHPLVSSREPSSLQTLPSSLQTLPSSQCGYVGLDHTVYFANGFITCPYRRVDEVIASAEAITHPDAEITAEVLDVKLYAENATAVLVECHWYDGPFTERGVPRRYAVPLMAEEVMASRRRAQCAERWETMRPYLLGRPCGKNSSPFVDKATGKNMKKVFMGIMESGAFGPMWMG